MGAFQNWGTVYPPATFVFLRLVTEQSCYIGEPISARDCDWGGRYAPYATYAMAVACAARLYWKTDRATAPFRTVVLALVFLEPWRGGLRIAALVCAYLLSIPNDVMITYISHTDQFSWWVNGNVLGDFGVAAGNIVRRS